MKNKKLKNRIVGALCLLPLVILYGGVLHFIYSSGGLKNLAIVLGIVVGILAIGLSAGHGFILLNKE